MERWPKPDSFFSIVWLEKFWQILTEFCVAIVQQQQNSLVVQFSLISLYFFRFQLSALFSFKPSTIEHHFFLTYFLWR